MSCKLSIARWILLCQEVSLAVKLQINRPKHSMSCFMGNGVVLGAYGIFVMRSEIYG